MTELRTTLSIGGRNVEAELVVFDKDGVLVDLHHPWAERTESTISALVRELGAGPALQEKFFRCLGYDAQAKRLAANGPLASASLAKLHTVAATVLYEHGLPWIEAEGQAHDLFISPMSQPPAAEEVRPLADVAGLFGQLTESGVRVAVVTSDDRAVTEWTLELLGATGYVSAIVCGDDPVPNKPAPDAIWRLQAELGVEPKRMVVVGDTLSDLQMATRAGAGWRVAVLSGAEDRVALSPQADIVIPSIQAIHVPAP